MYKCTNATKTGKHVDKKEADHLPISVS